MDNHTCASHNCGSPRWEAHFWCELHMPKRYGRKNPKKPCPECGGPMSAYSPACIFCERTYRHYGTYHPTLPGCRTCGAALPRKTRARAIYCSQKCKFADPEMRAKMGPPAHQVVKTCRGCMTTFSVPASNAERYNYCTLECSLSHRGELVPCKRCGKIFRRSFSSLRKHCSEACRRPAHMITCQECGEVFRDTPSNAKTRRFCGQACYRKHTGETSIEAKVREHLDQLGVLYFQEHQIGAWVVDFLVLPNLVVEADGDYWHTLRPEVDQRKTRELEAMGYRVLRCSETEINAGGFKDRLSGALG